MKNRKERILYYICIVISFLLFVNIFAPWIFYNDQTYTIAGFYRAVKNSGGLAAFSMGDSYIYPAYVFLVLPAIAGILSGIKTLLLIIKGRKRILSYAIYALEWGYMASIFAFQGYVPTLFACLSPVLAFAEFLINRYLEDYREIIRQTKELKEQERREKEERKRRLSFPGKYSAYFYRMMFRNARYQKKDYFLLLASGSFSVTFLFTILAIENILKDMHTTELFLLGDGMQGILAEAVLVAVAINIIMMAFSFAYYAKNKVEREQIMRLLGMRRQILNLMWVAEYAVCLLFSLLSGYLLGNGIVWVFKRVVKQNMEGGALPHISPKVYLWTILVFSVITFVSIIVNYEIYLWGKNTEVTIVKKEKIPKTRSIIIGLCAGTVLTGIGIYFYAQRKNAESMKDIYLFLAGSVLLLICLSAVWIKRKESGKSHFKQIIGRTPFYYHFGKTSQTLSILMAVHFLVLSVCTIQFAGVLSAKPARDLYPYDFVCMAYDADKEFFMGLEKECTAIEEYPMVRVTSVEGDAYDWKDAASNRFMGVLWPQGQNIGISESTYRKLNENIAESGKRLDLKGEEIHIVYQQDSSFKAHPLDWYLFRNEPYLRIGQPLRSYSFTQREELYPPRYVKSEEIAILTGMFQRGMQENIVVFSDEYFRTLQNQSSEIEGPDRYYLLRVKDNAYQSVKEKLQTFEKLHLSDAGWDSNIRPYYDSKEMIKNTESERLLKIMVGIFEILMLAACTVLVLSLKVVSERREIKERYEILFKIGMKERERKQSVRKEIRPFYTISLITAGIFAAFFTVLTFVLRMYERVQIMSYLKYAVIVWGVYLSIQMICYQCVKFFLYRLIEENKSTRRSG